MKKKAAKEESKSDPLPPPELWRDALSRLASFSNELIVGVDLGLHGAIALLSGDGQAVAAFHTPIIEVSAPNRKGKKTKNEYDLQLIAEMMETIDSRQQLYEDDSMTGFRRVTLVVESPVTMIGGKGRGEGGAAHSLNPTTAMVSGRGAGMWAWEAARFHRRYVEVAPVTWKRALGLLGKGKDDSRKLAQQLWPDLSLPLVKDDGRAESALIAEWGRRKLIHVSPEAEEVVGWMS